MRKELIFVGIWALMIINANAQGPKVDRGGKPEEKKSDFDALFGGGGSGSQGQGQGQANAALNRLLVTGKLADVFLPGKDNVTANFSALSQNDVRNLIQLKNLQCPNGTKVFAVSDLMIKEAIAVAATLQNILNNGDNANPNNLVGPDKKVRLLPLVCWNSTKENLTASLSNIAPGLINQVFHPKLLAHFSNDTATRLSNILPERIIPMLCEKFVSADLVDMLVVVQKFFVCDSTIMQAAGNNTLLAKAFLQGRMARGQGPLNDTELDSLMKNLGPALPRDFLKMASSSKRKERFADIWNKDKADAILGKINFSSVDDNFVASLGSQIACQLPTSALLKIPTDKLQRNSSSLACIKGETNAAKRRVLANKMLSTRNSTVCTQYLTTIDPTDEKCWRTLSPADLQAINISDSLAALQHLSCDTINFLKSRLQLGKVSNWTSDYLQKFSWMLRCLPALDSTDVKIVSDTILRGTPQTMNLDLPAALARKVVAAVRTQLAGNLGKLNSTSLTLLGAAAKGLTSSDIDSLLTDVSVDEALPKMQAVLSKMSRPARRALLNKLNLGQLKNRLCDLNSLADDVAGSQIANMTGLYSQLYEASSNCKFRCNGQEQCSAVFSNMASSLLINNVWNFSIPFLEWAQNSRVICGLTLENVISLQPDLSLLDVAKAYFNAGCKNPKSGRRLYEKVMLLLELYDQNSLFETQIELLGGNFTKHLSAVDLAGYSSETRQNILRSIGQADLDDVGPTWCTNMTKAALSAFFNDSSEIDEVAVLTLGNLVCGLDANAVNRLTAAALTDVLPKLSQCPDVSNSVLSAAMQAYKNKNLKNGSVNAVDLIWAGVAALSECQSIDSIPDAVKSEAVGDLALALKTLRERVKARQQQWRDASSLQTQNETLQTAQCTLRKVWEAKVRSRNSTNTRRRRSTGAITCDDILLLGEAAAVILTPQNISAIGDSDFASCAGELGRTEDWSQEQKVALAERAKAVWGAANTWSIDNLQQAGSIAQGLATAELSGLNLTLPVLEQWGQLRGWSDDQLKAGFSRWFSLDVSVGQKFSSITSSQLRQMGYFVCGMDVANVVQVNTEAFKAALSDIGDAAAQCSTASLQAWATLAVQAFGSVSTWTIPQTAAVDRILAGLNNAELAKLSSAQVSVMDLQTVSSIPASTFSALTTEQLSSLSVQQAMSLTDAQLLSLSKAQQDALAQFGIIITTTTTTTTKPTGAADGLTVTVSSLVVMATVSLFLLPG